MRRASVDFLQAPVTAARLALEPLEVTGDDVVAGRLIEPDTGAWYRIDVFSQSPSRRGRLRLRTANDPDAQGWRGCDCSRSFRRPLETCAAQSHCRIATRVR